MTIEELADVVFTMGENVNTLCKVLSLPKVDGTVTVGEWLNEWFVGKEKKLKTTTAKGYRHDLNYYILPSLGFVKLAELTYAQIQTFLNGIAFKNTRKKVGFLLNCALKRAKAIDKIAKNPYDAVELDGVKSEHYPPLEFDQQNAVMKKIQRGLFKSIFYFLCCTGLRIGEFLAIDFAKDIDVDKMEIIISKSKNRYGEITVPKTESGIRRIPFLPELFPCIAELNENQKQTALTYNMVRLFFYRLFKRLDMKGFNLHSMRHTFISICYSVGIRINYIKEIVGHSKIEMTLNVYTHRLKQGDSPILHYLERLATVNNLKGQ